ncbi:MAG: dimethyl sulfoxide reductase anchor subunit [Anaerolineales bacterium]|nr:dimethyl sulfoxide reductase anchor subunit [Anaerolineales bacterium]
METLSLPLILFTLLTQAAVGVAVLAAVRQWQTADGPQRPTAEWGTIAGLLIAGVLASFFHLGHPELVWRILTNVGTAWLSREILAFIVFGALVALALWSALRGPVSGWLLKSVAVVGVVALAMMGMTYAPAGQPAINNIWPFVFFMLTAATAGSAVASFFAPEAKQGLVAWVFSTGALISLVIYLAVPCVWLSGDAVVAATGRAFLSSPLYWMFILIGLVVPLIAVARTRRIPGWLPVLVLFGEFFGRAAFFMLMLTTGSNIGNLY